MWLLYQIISLRTYRSHVPEKLKFFSYLIVWSMSSNQCPFWSLGVIIWFNVMLLYIWKQRRSLNIMDNIVSSKMRSLKPFSFYYDYFPWKWLWPFIEINVKPVTQGCFLPHLVNVGKVILEKVHMWKLQYDSDKDRLRHYFFF